MDDPRADASALDLPLLEVRRWREHKGLTLASLARRAGTTPETIAAIEDGRLDPCATTLVALAHALEIRVGDLFGGPGC